jgi:release factor glutamine methyltransferase
MSVEPATVAAALSLARAAGIDRLDAQLLLAHVLGRSRTWLHANDDALLDAPARAAFSALVARRALGEPLAYLVGEKEFHGLSLRVDASVLVPRPDTEVLVEWAIEKLTLGTGSATGISTSSSAAPDASRVDAPVPTERVLDLGTGSGAISLAVKHACPAATVTATDVSDAALGVARANAHRLGLDVTFLPGNWWQAVGAARFDLVLSNPPYIAGGDPHLPALRHEPALALTPGGDGLGALREIVASARHHLADGGWLLLEHGHDQAGAVQALLRAAGFEAVESRRDLGGNWRCTGGRWPTPGRGVSGDAAGLLMPHGAHPTA